VLGVWPVAVITKSAGLAWPEASVTVVGSRGKPLGGMTAREPVTSLHESARRIQHCQTMYDHTPEVETRTKIGNGNGNGNGNGTRESVAPGRSAPTHFTPSSSNLFLTISCSPSWNLDMTFSLLCTSMTSLSGYTSSISQAI
jgi:hypothetical protein